MIYILVYLLIGIVVTGLLYETEEGDEIRNIIAEAVITIVGWPFIVYLVIRDLYDREEGDE